MSSKQRNYLVIQEWFDDLTFTHLGSATPHLTDNSLPRQAHAAARRTVACPLLLLLYLFCSILVPTGTHPPRTLHTPDSNGLTAVDDERAPRHGKGKGKGKRRR